MYLPKHFTPDSPDRLHRLIREHPLGAIVTHGPQGLDADHVPFEFDPDAGPAGTLSAHVARANPLWQRCPSGTEVMVIFRGAQAYVSPNWYPSKHETHRQVPTWNYEVVHAYGTVTVHDNDRWVRALVSRLTRHHEASEPRPWKMGEAPPDYLDTMLANIVGLEIVLHRLVGKSKLSQNREPRDRLNAADTLQGHGHEELARAMREAGG